MSAEMIFLLEGMDRIVTPRRVRIERNPLDFCDVCGAEDKHDAWPIDFQNGREVKICDECA